MVRRAHVEVLKLAGWCAGAFCTIAGGYTLLQDSQKRKIEADPASKYPKNLEDKVYLVTGANTG